MPSRADARPWQRGRGQRQRNKAKLAPLSRNARLDCTVIWVLLLQPIYAPWGGAGRFSPCVLCMMDTNAVCHHVVMYMYV